MSNQSANLTDRIESALTAIETDDTVSLSEFAQDIRQLIQHHKEDYHKSTQIAQLAEELAVANERIKTYAICMNTDGVDSLWKQIRSLEQAQGTAPEGWKFVPANDDSIDILFENAALLLEQREPGEIGQRCGAAIRELKMTREIPADTGKPAGWPLSADAANYPNRELAGAHELIRAIISGAPIWPNDWGQDVAAVAFMIEKLRKQVKADPPDHKKFAIVMDRYDDGPSLAIFDGEHYVFCDGDCFHKDGDFLDGYPAKFFTDFELQQLISELMSKN